MRAKDPLVGKLLDGRYELIQRLSAGGAGVVYRARHKRLERQFAVKVLTGGIETDALSVARFEREAKLTSRLQHPNIVEITDFGIDNDLGLYLVMEFVPGITIRQMVRWNGPMDVDAMIEVSLQICAGVGAAHEAGIVHRDLKAHNVMIIERDDAPPIVKILDFGIAGLADADEEGKRLTRTGILMGTPAYMSPEQTLGKRPDHLADIYAFGVMAYEMLAGVVPLRGRSALETLQMHRKSRPKRIAEVVAGREVPEHLERVIFTCLAKAKEKRPASFAIVEKEIRRVADSRGSKEEDRSQTLQIDLAKIRAAIAAKVEPPPLPPEPDRFDTSAGAMQALAADAAQARGDDTSRVGGPADESQKGLQTTPIDPAQPEAWPGPQPRSAPSPWKTAVILIGASLAGGLLMYVVGTLVFT